MSSTKKKERKVKKSKAKSRRENVEVAASPAQLFRQEELKYRSTKQKLARQSAACLIFKRHLLETAKYPIYIPKELCERIRKDLLVADPELFLPVLRFLDDPMQWSVDDVLEWLDSVNLSEYKEIFKSNEISGNELFELGMNDLEKDLQMRLLSRKKFMSEIQKLKKLVGKQ
eukprot:TRINITY_DN975_c0_g2_i1.p1 TRINITY_DN975_c0_g2~~TRINITY_DN975_c0_g2_i1.p1  ORF type:complete len:172 (-),score=18.64 TRINITY_DN975_c0_g2_i1:52-567(-)